jgi:capsule polysaccharide export protein KpsE/RkpR
MGVKHDSLLIEVIDDFREKQLIIAKPNRKLMILSVKVEDHDPFFAEKFNTFLVEIVNNFYEKTSTKKTAENLRILQNQADSVRIILNHSLDQLAKISELQPNPNPLYYTNQVPFQKLQIDIEASAAVYEEIVKNLEMAKITHRNKKPLIQIIDEPVKPLSIDKARPLKLIATSGLIGGLFMLLFFIFKYVWRKLMQIS